MPAYACKRFLLFVFLLPLIVKFECFAKVLFIDNFDEKQEINFLGGKMGVWLKDPYDPTQSCVASYSEKEKFGESGSSLHLVYDIDSPEVAYNGFWMKLEDVDVSDFNRLVFFVKGDPDQGFSNSFQIELKNEKEVSRYNVIGVTNKWQKYSIPFSSFKEITDWTRMKELVITFSDQSVNRKVGGFYFDNFCFSDGKAEPKEFELIEEDSTSIINTIVSKAESENLEVTKQDNKVSITLHINFDLNETNIRDDEIEKIAKVFNILNQYPNLKVLIKGHTDSTGKPSKNRLLSEKRALSVMMKLIDLGIDKNRLSIIGMGDLEPIAPNDTEEGRLKNRRVEFIIQ